MIKRINNHNTSTHRSSKTVITAGLPVDMKYMYILRPFFFYTASFLLLPFISCRRFVEIPPPATRLIAASVYSTNSTASAAVTGIYAAMIRNSIGGGASGLSVLLGLSADEFKLYPTSNSVAGQTYANELLNTTEVPFWTSFYSAIYQINLAIEEISKSSGVTPLMKQQLIGELKFLRAFCHFYLVNIYGDVPFISVSDYHANSIVSRDSASSVYDHITNDLIDAQSLLSDNYLNPDGGIASQRVRPNLGAASALLARVYLYEGKWDLAEMQATNVINNNAYQLSVDLNKVFLASNNKEAIWQLESPNNGFSAPDGMFLSAYLSTTGPSSNNPFLINDSLIKTFETGDLRKTNWIISKTFSGVVYNFPFKYKLYQTNQPPTEHQVVFRLAEQYLIRAEARARQNKISSAIVDLDSVRKRAGLPLISTINPNITQTSLLEKIIHERQVELFTEYGHRWFDLKRTGKVGSIMGTFSPLKGGSWQPTDELYPIPLSEVQKNPNIWQNPGYQ